MDGVGGKPKLKESCKKIENLCSYLDRYMEDKKSRSSTFYVETEEPNNTSSFRFLVDH